MEETGLLILITAEAEAEAAVQEPMFQSLQREMQRSRLVHHYPVQVEMEGQGAKAEPEAIMEAEAEAEAEAAFSPLYAKERLQMPQLFQS